MDEFDDHIPDFDRTDADCFEVEFDFDQDADYDSGIECPDDLYGDYEAGYPEDWGDQG